MSAALQFRDVTVAVASGRQLLQHVSLAIEHGTVAAILGRSGSGKTTLLRTANRMVVPTSGVVEIAGASEIDLVGLRRRIGYVIQEAGLFPHFTVERNVGIILEAEGRPKAQRSNRTREVLQLVGLDPASFAHRYPHQLSGGQRQRVGLARALAAEPPILLMDEPFGALDPLTRSEMQDMLRALLHRVEITVLFVTHNLDEALYLADQIALLNEGKLIIDMPRDEFLSSTKPEIVAYVRAFRRAEDGVNRKAHPA
ncbi:MAG TPA: ATP-binding cassette domain-containing protein [Terracidiphilus sp.]|jgi:osmoprotectant transport system ATP-binding protein|nr:ATP-binding cassette domain-containing protein [Terracidiphilus sp.]